MRRAVLAGLLAGALAVAFLVVRDAEREPAAAGLLRAYRASLTGTYVLEQDVTRRLVSGRTFRSEVRIVQRPPDRIRVDGSGTTGRVGGRTFGCVAGGGCRWGGPAERDAAFVDGEVALLRALVTGDGAAYAVRRAGRGCYVLVLRARVLAPPYGEDATLCFDATTGALVRAVVHRAEATDTTTTRLLRGRVTARDLSLPAALSRGVEAE